MRNVLKNSGSSVDFIKLNEKDSLNPYLEFATKNDGAEVYFELRETVF